MKSIQIIPLGLLSFCLTNCEFKVPVELDVDLDLPEWVQQDPRQSDKSDANSGDSNQSNSSQKPASVKVKINLPPGFNGGNTSKPYRPPSSASNSKPSTGGSTPKPTPHPVAKPPAAKPTPPKPSTPSTSSGGSSADSHGGVYRPRPLTRFSYQLDGSIRSHNVNVYFVDLFDQSASKIRSLKSGGRKVICYFSAGSAENWRSDYKRFPSSAKGNGLEGWSGEKWLDTRNGTVRSIMRSRIDLAKKKGCDGVDPDNVDGYGNKTGYSLSRSHSIDYLRHLASYAHSKGLSIGLKNSAEIASSLASTMDFAVVEECGEYNECGRYRGFVSKNKAVFRVEYRSYSSSWCSSARSSKMTLIFSNYSLNGSIKFCP